jgi:PiT family inorganic phosphate transporter
VLLMALLLIALTLGVAFANGANDVSKGIATLVGAGLATERRAMLWGTVWTLLGVGAALLLARGLVGTFSGHGLLVAPPAGLIWPAAVAAGVIGWLLLATRVGMPVSTTHALVGAIIGAGMVAGGPGGVLWAGVLTKVGLPLLVSPFLSLALVFGLLPAATSAFRRVGKYCVCVEQHELVLATTGTGEAVLAGREIRLLAAADCPPRVLTRVNALDSLHWLTAGFTSFARGLNDSPKVLALGLVASAGLGFEPNVLLLLVAVAMGAGSWYGGRRVTGTLATKVTPMSGPEALTANAVTSGLVGIASNFGWPVSTTHVAAGTVMAVGIHRRELHMKLAKEMLLAWLVTVPVAGLLAAAVYAAAVR